MLHQASEGTPAQLRLNPLLSTTGERMKTGGQAQDSKRRFERERLQELVTGGKKSKRSPAGSGVQTWSALRSPPRSSSIGVDLSNLALSKGKPNVRGLNFADILDDVTYLPDPGASQPGQEPDAAFLRLPPAKDPRVELKIASYTQSGQNRARYDQ